MITDKLEVYTLGNQKYGGNQVINTYRKYINNFRGTRE
jgi:hypothetical protein